MPRSFTAMVVGIFACLGAFAQTVYTLDLSKRYQRIDNFGASDCWSAQRVGLYPDATRERVADWLFDPASPNALTPFPIPDGSRASRISRAASCMRRKPMLPSRA